MRNSKAGRILICMLFSTATFGVISGAALADDVATIYGRSSESGAMGESVNSAVPEDVSNAYGRAPEAELTADEPRYQLTFTLMQGVHRDDLPAVDVWPGAQQRRWTKMPHGKSPRRASTSRQVRTADSGRCQFEPQVA